MSYGFVCALLLAGSAQAGMIGAPVTSILHTMFAGSWPSSSSATVGPGVEFTRLVNGGGGDIDTLTLDIANTSFTFTFQDAGPDAFNQGLNGFEFTDLNQTFTGISLEPGNTFPAGTVASSSVTPNNSHIFMNNQIIPGGTTWTATWDVTFAAQAPEPGTLPLTCLALVGLALAANRVHRSFSHSK